MSYVNKQLNRLEDSPDLPHKIKISGGGGGETNYIDITPAQWVRIRRALLGRRAKGLPERYKIRIVNPHHHEKQYYEYRGRSVWCESAARKHLTDWRIAHPGKLAEREEV